MAKTIKFNLICDEYPARTLDDVREHFSIEDMLHYYKTGLLARWLDVRNFKEEKTQIDSITETEDALIVKRLATIFGVAADEKEIEKIVNDWDDWKKDKKEKHDFVAEKSEKMISAQKTVEEHFIAYTQLKTRIISAKNKPSIINFKRQLRKRNLSLMYLKTKSRRQNKRLIK